MQLQDIIYRIILQNAHSTSYCRDILYKACDIYALEVSNSVSRKFSDKYICVYSYDEYVRYTGSKILRDQYDMITGGSAIYMPIKISKESYDICSFILSNNEIIPYHYTCYDVLDTKNLTTYENLQVYETSIYGDSSGQ